MTKLTFILLLSLCPLFGLSQTIIQDNATLNDTPQGAVGALDPRAGKACHTLALMKFEERREKKMAGGDVFVRPATVTLYFTQEYICDEEKSGMIQYRHLMVVISDSLVREGAIIKVPEEVSKLTFAYEHKRRYTKSASSREVNSFLHSGTIVITENDEGRSMKVRFDLEFEDADNITLPKILSEEARFVPYPK